MHLVSRETAGLFRTLRRRRPLPPGTSSPAQVAGWVLDGILEIEHAGRMRSGPAAHSLFFPLKAAPSPRNGPGILSLEALRYAASLGATDPLVLADRLYRYNTKPASPSWCRSLRGTRNAARLLQADRNGRAIQIRRGRDEILESPGGRGIWRVWENPDGKSPAPDAPTFKLYVSPVPEAVGEALRALLALFETRGAPFSAKVGRDLPNLLRPDKLVAYFSRRADLFDAAEKLHRRLGGMPSQGVPFTAAFGEGALLSWATDPPDDAEPPGPHRRGSWRGWVTTRLGAALASALAANAEVVPWRFALDRVSLDGVDPTRWVRPEWSEAAEQSHADH